MRLAAVLLALAPAATLAQLPSEPPPPGIDVERTALAPGEAKAFTLAPGTNHQLLRPAALDAKGAVTVRYSVDGGRSVLTAVNRTGRPLGFTVLAKDGPTGGFVPAGDVALPAGGTPVTRAWPGAIGPINIGDFVGGPHGANEHAPAGE